MEFLRANVLFIQFVVIVFLVLLDVVVTVAFKIGTGNFEWDKLMLFLKVYVLRYVLIWGVLGGIAYGAQYLQIRDGTLLAFGVFVDIIYALIVAKLARQILITFKDMGIEEPVVTEVATTTKKTGPAKPTIVQKTVTKKTTNDTF